jgi:hypothetical protein
MSPTDLLFKDLVAGVLTLSLIKMGVIAAKQIADFRAIGPMLVFSSNRNSSNNWGITRGVERNIRG